MGRGLIFAGRDKFAGRGKLKFRGDQEVRVESLGEIRIPEEKEEA